MEIEGPGGDDVTRLTKMISHGKDETDLYSTFTGRYTFCDIEEGEEEARKASEQLDGIGRATVLHIIDVRREMVKDGKIAGFKGVPVVPVKRKDNKKERSEMVGGRKRRSRSRSWRRDYRYR